MRWDQAAWLANQLGGLAALAAISWAAILILRATGLSKSSPADMTEDVSPRALILIVCAILAYLAASLLMRYPPHLSRPAAVAVFAALLALPIGVLVGASVRKRDPVLVRVSSRAARGDIDGAIVELQAVIDHRSLWASQPPDTPDADPWAPPRVGLSRDKRAANRLNLMGSLHALRAHWPAALEGFERAERSGGPVRGANIGRALIMLGRDDEGADINREAVALFSEQEPLVRFGLTLALAQTLADRGRWDEARAALDESAEALRASNPFLPWTRRRLGQDIGAVRGRLPRARA